MALVYRGGTPSLVAGLMKLLNSTIRKFVPARMAQRHRSLDSLQLIFVVGCERSGLTLVSQILGAHPHAILIDEDQGAHDLAKAARTCSESFGRTLELSLSQARKMYTEDFRFSSPNMLDDSVTHLILKVPDATYDFDQFQQWHTPRMHFVFPHRDVRDVVCSMLRMPHIPIVERQLNLIALNQHLPDQFSDELSITRDPETPELTQKALIWKMKSQLLCEFAKSPLNALSIRYEELVDQQEYWISKLLDHVRLDQHKDAYNHEGTFRGLGPGLTLRSRKIDDSRVNRWQDQLSAAQEKHIWNVAASRMQELGYARMPAIRKKFPTEIHPKLLSEPVIATGRGGSGTRLLSQLLQEHNIFLGNRFNRSEDSVEWADILYELSIQKLMRKLPPQSQWQSDLTSRARDVLSVGKLRTAQRWGWKLPETMLVLPEVTDTFCNAKVIHLVRHPLDACLRRTHVTSRLDNPVGKATLQAAYDWLHWHHKPEEDEEHIHNAASWAFQVSQVTRLGRVLGSGHYLELRYEDLCQNGQDASNQLAEFLDLSPTTTSISQNVDHNRCRRWKSNDRRIDDVWSICRETATLLGYQVKDQTPPHN